MALHLQKLCVGAEGIEDLERWIAERLARMEAEGQKPEQIHTTRMMPKRAEELLQGGSLYWVIKGVMLCRQRLLDFRPVVGEDGITRCQIVLEPQLVTTRSRPRRPFQGWRYLEARQAPLDLACGFTQDAPDMPVEMRRELIELGLL